MTTPRLFKSKVRAQLDDLDSVRHVLLIGIDRRRVRRPASPRPRHVVESRRSGVHDRTDASRNPCAAALHQRHDGQTQRGRPRTRRGRHPLLHRPVVLDLHPDDVFWCTADPGWVTGTSYGIIAPLTHGRHQHHRRGRLRRRALVRDPRGAAGDRLVHRADRDPHDDAGRGGRGSSAQTCRACASWPASASRSTPRRSCGAQKPSACRSSTTGGRPRPAAS